MKFADVKNPLTKRFLYPENYDQDRNGGLLIYRNSVTWPKIKVSKGVFYNPRWKIQLMEMYLIWKNPVKFRDTKTNQINTDPYRICVQYFNIDIWRLQSVPDVRDH